jgi:hypothetical protein
MALIQAVKSMGISQTFFACILLVVDGGKSLYFQLLLMCKDKSPLLSLNVRVCASDLFGVMLMGIQLAPLMFLSVFYFISGRLKLII